MTSRKLTHNDYLIGWICILEVEQIAALHMLDEEHDRLPQEPSDHNVYVLGAIHEHNVVIAALPSAGNSMAATVATQMRMTFPQMRFALLVGIGAGVPVKTDKGWVRLGDVVNKPHAEHSGAVHYDHGKAEVGSFRRIGSLGPPPTTLLNAAQILTVRRDMMSSDPLEENIRRINTRIRSLKRFRHPGRDRDKLYKADYTHPDRSLSCLEAHCADSELVTRENSNDDSDEDSDAECPPRVVVHRGTIASGELVLKNGVLRDLLAKQYEVLCFEMEAAGVLTDFPCLVIRGISDYSDSHKNDIWQGYAAASAAAFAREIFVHLPIADVERCKVPVEDIEFIKSKLEDLVMDASSMGVVAWLAAPDASRNYVSALDRRHKGTNVWFLKSDAFQKWMNRPNAFLWLYGKIGCGKSILSASIIEHLIKNSSTQSCITVYFSFDFNDAEKQSYETMLRSLVLQLCSKSEQRRQMLGAFCQSCDRGRQQPSREQMQDFFWAVSGTFKCVQIVVDALDECHSRDNLFSWMKKVARSSTGFALIAISRWEGDIESTFKTWIHDNERFQIQEKQIDEDIHQYVRARLATDSGFQRWHSSPCVQKKIQDGIMSKAGGMFRWAACQLDALKHCIHLRALEKALASLPGTLDETYARILRNNNRSYAREAIRVLQFLIYSNRPLRIEETIDIIATEVEEKPAFDPDLRMPDPDDIVLVCSSLIVVTNRIVNTAARQIGSHTHTQNSLPQSSTITEIQLAHSSVKEYLMSDRVEEPFRTSFKPGNAKCRVVETCVSYLTNLDRDIPTHDFVRRMIEKDLPLAVLAANLWFKYAAVAEKEETGTSVFITDNLFLKPKAFWNWIDCMSLRSREAYLNFLPPGDMAGPPHPIHYAASYGLILSVERLLRWNFEIGESSDLPDRALLAAAKAGHTDVVLYLISVGANVNAQHERRTALQKAIQSSFSETALALIANGAALVEDDPPSPFSEPLPSEWRWGSALEEASTAGLEDLVKYLVGQQDDYKDTSLLNSSEQGHQKVVQILVANGADVNKLHKHGMYSTCLMAASDRGHVDIVKMLLDKGADVETRNPYMESDRGIFPEVEDDDALSMAAYMGHYDIVQMLLEYGADPNTSCDHVSPLAIASYRGRTDVIRLLLAKGADLEARSRGRNNWLTDDSKDTSLTALQWASFKGHEGAVRILVDNGADVNAPGGRYGTSLGSASVQGYEKIVQILLDAGAEPNTNDAKCGSSALVLAISNAKVRAASILLDRGSDIHSQEKYNIDFQAALKAGQIELVLMLLARTCSNLQENSTLELWIACLSSGEGHQKLFDNVHITNDIAGYSVRQKADQDDRQRKTIQANVSGAISATYPSFKWTVDPGVQWSIAIGLSNILHEALSLDPLLDAKQLLLEWRNKLDALLELIAARGAQNDSISSPTPTQDGRSDFCKETSRSCFEKVLECAAGHGDSNIVQSLLADGNLPTEGALEVSVQHGYAEVVCMLLENGAIPTDQSLQDALHRCYEAIVKLLVAKGANVNSASERYRGEFWSPLSIASGRGHMEIVLFLLDSGADVDGASDSVATVLSMSPLMAAIQRGFEDVALLLLRRGANARKMKARHGIGSLFVGPELFRALLEKRADLEAHRFRDRDEWARSFPGATKSPPPAPLRISDQGSTFLARYGRAQPLSPTRTTFTPPGTPPFSTQDHNPRFRLDYPV